MHYPLEGIKVLDLSQFLSGPRCTQLLADLGAEVVKLEGPAGETMRLWMKLIPGQEKSFSNWHRSKQGVTLNLKHPEGVALFKKLVPHFDVLVENLSPGALEEMGAGWEALHQLHPGLVYCSISGFGRDAPLSHRPAFDLIAQATGGIMAAQNMRSRSPGVFFGDLVSGAYAAVGILAALRYREATGQGQLVDVSMQDVMYFHNFRSLQSRSAKGEESALTAALGGSFDDLFTSEEGLPFWRPYPARDGYIAVVFLTDKQWKTMCDLIGQPELKDDPRFSNFVTRVKNREVVRQALADWMKTKTVREIEKLLDRNKIPCGVVLSCEETNEDENLKARGMIASVEDQDHQPVPTPGIPIRLSASPGALRSAAPKLGEHNQAVLGKLLGLSGDELKQLKARGVI
jgi:crotonobetainyl-CoA:carnitine CoA-transferase CaiB-like acyl-CoA transferase